MPLLAIVLPHLQISPYVELRARFERRTDRDFFEANDFVAIRISSAFRSFHKHCKERILSELQF